MTIRRRNGNLCNSTPILAFNYRTGSIFTVGHCKNTGLEVGLWSKRQFIDFFHAQNCIEIVIIPVAGCDDYFVNPICFRKLYCITNTVKNLFTFSALQIDISRESKCKKVFFSNVAVCASFSKHQIVAVAIGFL